MRAPLAWLGPGRLVRDAVVVCGGDAVVYAGDAAAAPGAAEVLEVDGFLMSAAADRHVHIGLSDPAAVLLGGVTAVRDLAWPAEPIFALADASEMPSFNGPLIRAAGPMLTAPGGYPMKEPYGPPGYGRELHGPEDAGATVRELAAGGATAVKLSLNSEAGPTPTDAELAAACTVAAEAGVPVTAHAQGAGEVERALGAGVAELAHAPWTERLSDRLVEALARTTRIVSTLHILSLHHGDAALGVALDNLRRFRAAGGRVVYGTDLGSPEWGIAPGIDVREASLLLEAGLAEEELMEAVALGALEPGAPADLIALARNPLEEPDALAELLLVIRAGRRVIPA